MNRCLLGATPPLNLLAPLALLMVVGSGAAQAAPYRVYVSGETADQVAVIDGATNKIVS